MRALRSISNRISRWPNCWSARSAKQQNRNADALAIYRGIGKDSPFHWTAQLRMAMVLDMLDRTDEARSKLETMAADHPDRAEPLIELGDIERGHSNFDAAASRL